TKNVLGLPDGIPIAWIAGDQQAALFGQTCFDQGDAKCTFGTGSFLLTNTGAKKVSSKKGLLTTVAWQLKGDKKLTYALEGGAFICGAAVQWLRDGLNFISSSGEVEQLASEVADAGGVEFVPALTGLGAPYWDANARGLICGLTRGTTKAHVARATLEAMALQNHDILIAMQKDMGKKLKSIKVDGGATKNNLLMQLQADYLGQSIERPKTIESTVLGAAYLAGLGVGFWKNTSELKKIWKLDREFKPALSTSARVQRLKSWSKAIERTMR
ncbi:MAG: FGGY-family carbohydrate kinase, partial [Bdellovibrionales bacterium]